MIHNRFLGGWCGRTVLEFYHDLVRLDFIIITKTRKLLKYQNRADSLVCSIFYATDLILY